MKVDHLIHMANRIGEFFASMQDTHEAHEGIAQHLRKFWEPRMRSRLLAHLDVPGAPGLMPLVCEALHKHRHQWPQPSTHASTAAPSTPSLQAGESGARGALGALVAPPAAGHGASHAAGGTPE